MIKQIAVISNCIDIADSTLVNIDSEVSYFTSKYKQMQTIATSSRTAQVNLHTLSPVMISFNVNINRKDITDKTGYYTVAVNECIATIPIDNDNITVHAEFTALIKQYNNTVDITTIAYDNDDNIINTDDTVNINCSIYCL